MRRALVAALLLACSKGNGTQDASVHDASIDGGSMRADLARAEDERAANKVPEQALTSRDVTVRRRAAMALARIADVPSEAGLLHLLADEDSQAAAWAAYGLGFSCKGHEDVHVNALAARAASLEVGDAGATGSVDLRFAIVRALGRCGGQLAEGTLSAWVKTKNPWREHAAYGLGDVAARRGGLDDDTITNLLDAAADGLDAALYPFARAERFNDAFAARLLESAKKVASGAPSETRVFAVRALGKAGTGAIPELQRIALATDYSWGERIDAARSLGKLGEAGHVAATTVLEKLLPAKDAIALLVVGGDMGGLLIVALGALGVEPPKNALHVLREVSALRAPGEAPEPLARRLGNLRCTAAALLSAGAFDAEVIRTCDAEGTEALEHARLVALSKRPLAGDRRAAWLALAKSEHLKVREEALELIGPHKELGDLGLTAITTALGDTKHAGVVATAASVLENHPERALVLSAKERKNALDPRAPMPTANPEQEISPVISKALQAAVENKWNEDLIETRTALLAAAVALKAPFANAAAKAACGDPNQTMREHGMKALRALGDTKATCSAPSAMPSAKELAASHGGKLVLKTDAGDLSITFDVALAPIASTRILDLAKAGFYDNVVVHRVVPGFVVQFGDPQGDGYGGSGTALRCETSPVPFGYLDVGVALAGRDTGSSQIFVTLGRFPHLDGDYARIGRAEGDWLGVAEGDVIRKATVE